MTDVSSSMRPASVVLLVDAIGHRETTQVTVTLNHVGFNPRLLVTFGKADLYRLAHGIACLDRAWGQQATIACCIVGLTTDHIEVPHPGSNHIVPGTKASVRPPVCYESQDGIYCSNTTYIYMRSCRTRLTWTRRIE